MTDTNTQNQHNNHQWILKILDGAMKDATMPMQNGIFTIGKGGGNGEKKNDIILDDAEILETHCTIQIEGGDIVILGASGAVYHNNRHITNPTNYVIKQGGYLTIGQTSMGLGNDIIGFPPFKKFTPIMVRSANNTDAQMTNNNTAPSDPLLAKQADNLTQKIKNSLFWLVIILFWGVFSFIVLVLLTLRMILFSFFVISFFFETQFYVFL